MHAQKAKGQEGADGGHGNEEGGWKGKRERREARDVRGVCLGNDEEEVGILDTRNTRDCGVRSSAYSVLADTYVHEERNEDPTVIRGSQC